MSAPLSGTIRVGTAGWSIGALQAAAFPGLGSHLERYAARMNAVEINSSFYRPHRTATYRRWAASVPDGFRFAVKVPRSVTHERRLAGCDELVQRFLGEVEGFGDKLGVLLLQLPPSLTFEPTVADRFFARLRRETGAPVACEPRHRSWFADDADRFLAARGVARVAADPALVPAAGEPGGFAGLRYTRLHGSPQVYSSPYAPSRLAAVGTDLRAAAVAGTSAWCILDNTAQGHALPDALTLARLIRGDDD